MKILNWITEHDLDQLKRRGWIERQRELRLDERRILTPRGFDRAASIVVGNLAFCG